VGKEGEEHRPRQISNRYLQRVREVGGNSRDVEIQTKRALKWVR
jgi:hypothetical protein